MMINLFNINNAEFGYYYEANSGNKINCDTTGTSNFIEVKQGSTYTTSFDCNITYWDENKNYINGEISYKQFTVPNNNKIKYIKMSIWGTQEQMNNWELLEIGEATKPNEPITPEQPEQNQKPIIPIEPNLSKNYYYNVKDYGVIGDGVNDDTNAIQNLINKIGNSGGGIILFPNGNYKFTKMLEITHSNLTLKGETNSKLQYHGLGKDMYFIYIHGTWQNKNYVENTVLDGITLDLTYQQFKGGASENDLQATSPLPIHGAETGIFMQYCYNCKIINCKLKDIYGNGMYLNRCSFCTVDNCFLEDCSASRMGDTNSDYQGDGIGASMSFGIMISNNKVINRRVFKVHNEIGWNSLNCDVYGKQCARSGLEFEYPVNMDAQGNQEIWCPYADLINNVDGYALTFKDNYVYGYNKGIHLEHSVNALVEGNTIVHCNIGIIDATGGHTMIVNNEFDSDNVCKSPQGGYDWYYCSIALTHFLGDRYNNAMIIGNRFRGDADGICFGRNYVNIINNDFRNTGICIRQRGDNRDNIVIEGNKIIMQDKLEDGKTEAWKFDLYTLNNSTIQNNTFISENYHMLLGMSVINCIISGNIFRNTRINLFYGNYYNVFTNNVCKETLITDGSDFNIFPSNNSIITNNIFEGVNSNCYGNGWEECTLRDNIYIKNGKRVNKYN